MNRPHLLAATATFLTIVAVLTPLDAQDQRAAEQPGVFLLDAQHLVSTRAAIQAGDERFSAALAKLERDAQEALSAGPYSVTSKEILPPSGDKHDYVSQGPYWWPNPKTDDGLPYVRRDGERNPEIDKHTDRGNMQRMITDSETLALAWYFTGKPPYAERAARLLRTWFLDADTRMNPHLRFGQAIPGRTEGRGIGIIETRGLPRVVDAAGLLSDSPAWTEADQQGLAQWFDQYLTWLLESKHGRDEAATKNNHGTWYDVQVASFALFVGKDEIAKKVLSESRTRRIADQIQPDGRQPRELSRTRPWSYSVMNLHGMLQLAVLGDHVGLDLWNYRTADGRGLRPAVDWLLPFATGREPWKKKEIGGFHPERFQPVAYLAATRYRDAEFTSLAAEIPPPASSDRTRLLLPVDLFE